MTPPRTLVSRVVIAIVVPVVAVAIVNRIGWLGGPGGAITAFAVVAWVGALLIFRRDQAPLGKKRRRRRKRESTLD